MGSSVGMELNTGGGEESGKINDLNSIANAGGGSEQRRALICISWLGYIEPKARQPAEVQNAMDVTIHIRDKYRLDSDCKRQHLRRKRRNITGVGAVGVQSKIRLDL